MFTHHMSSNRPVGSVTDREGWEWNKRRAERTSKGRFGGASDRPPNGSQRRTPPERDAASQREIKRVEAELERTEERLQSVIDRYERLLEEKNQQLADRTPPASKPERGSSILSKLYRYVPIAEIERSPESTDLR